ncbi:hypothetical protein K431DRAFT_330620 [Polychaeton citri CBS 116435]|uniref:Uncharacterized protein n=1 Tax=Polychaeton citri CBS 116435 TaxID=1314669 RepID=A0A9P4PXE2_9PEZI|nr:hypothetical protein K431DRAFT_330620 [Polychaeton citri CBS 116435]
MCCSSVALSSLIASIRSIAASTSLSTRMSLGVDGILGCLLVTAIKGVIPIVEYLELLYVKVARGRSSGHSSP